MMKVCDLRKRFGTIVAVDGISFEVSRGDVLGFLGPNGAGKSTTMKMLSGFLRPDSGTATITGYDVVRQSLAVRQNLGYLAENAPAYEEMTVDSFLRFVCDARRIRGAGRQQAIDRVTQSCALQAVMHQPIGTLSKGFRRRTGLAQALIHNPPVLIMDEPTDGLDPNQKHEVHRLIRSLAKEKCIILSTHILEEVDAVCNRVVIIARGKVLENSTPEALCKREGGTLDEVFRKLTAPKRPAVKGGVA
jgi:ABC-2 type transport system ATP-binding protein